MPIITKYILLNLIFAILNTPNALYYNTALLALLIVLLKQLI